MAQLDVRCSTLYWICSTVYWLCMVSVVLVLHGQRCTGSAWSALHAVYDERCALFNVVLVHLIVACTTLHGQRCSALLSVALDQLSVARCALHSQRCSAL